MNIRTTQINSNTLIWEDSGDDGFIFMTESGVILDYFGNHNDTPQWVQGHIQRGGDPLTPLNITVQQLERLERVWNGGLGWCETCQLWIFDSKKCEHCDGNLQCDFPDMSHGVDY